MDLCGYVASQGTRNYSFRWINCTIINLVFYAHILLREHHIGLFAIMASLEIILVFLIKLVFLFFTFLTFSSNVLIDFVCQISVNFVNRYSVSLTFT